MAEDHIGQEFLARDYASIAATDAFDDDADDAWGDGDELVCQLLGVFDERTWACMQAQQGWHRFHRFGCCRQVAVNRTDGAANGEALYLFAQGIAEIIDEFFSDTPVDYIEGGMQKLAVFQVLNVVAIGQFKAHFSCWTNRKQGDVTVMPGRYAIGHANGGMDNGIRLFANTHEELAHDMRFPGQLRGISDVLPLAAAVCE